MRFVIATRHGGSVMVSLTGIIKEGEEYLVHEEDGQIILTPSKQAYKVLNQIAKTAGQK